MGLSDSIVIVNEFTVKTSNGGTRGGTPGEYITRYMGRDGATEPLTPVRLNELDSYIQCYMAREEATESIDYLPELKPKMRRAQKQGGVAFGNGDVSLSNEQVEKISNSIQSAFDDGKTIMKTVLSFDEEYLREAGIIDEDFVCAKPGDYRGNIDQFRLREAIMHGMERMAPMYDDLEYIGVIQVDTRHVHCHLCMVDHGEGTVTKDGTQYGKLTKQHKTRLRRGIDAELGHSAEMARTYSNIDFSKRNVKGFVKKFALKSVELNGGPQFLLACLPDDKRAWRAGTNRQDMKKANYIVREFVTQVLEQDDSGYYLALRSLGDYADARAARDGLGAEERDKLFQAGQERLIEDCMNGVYGVLKNITEDEKSVRTPLMDVMSSSYETSANKGSEDPLFEFGFKLRSYQSRLDHHRVEKKRYEVQRKAYENTENPTEASRPLYEFLKFEEEYNAMLMAKYQHFLRFVPEEEAYEDDLRSLLRYKSRVHDMERMIADKDMNRMTQESAEEYGRFTYGQSGGRFKIIQPAILDGRLDQMRARYDAMEDDFRDKLADYGMSMDSDGQVRHEPKYDFQDVKALDLHHLSYDFPSDVRVSNFNVQRFVDVANQRYELYGKAREYLIASDQERNVRFLPEYDVMQMKELADRMTANGTLVSMRKPDGGKFKKSKTIRLDNDYRRDMDLVVRTTVDSTRFEFDNI